jgi:Multiprotein bridging factor 1
MMRYSNGKSQTPNKRAILQTCRVRPQSHNPPKTPPEKLARVIPSHSIPFHFISQPPTITIMPQQVLPSGQDWGAVNVGSGAGGLLKNKTSVPKTERELSLAKAAGLVATEKRYGAGGNKSAHSGGTAGATSARKLEEATEVGTIAKVDKSLSLAIMQVSSYYWNDRLYVLWTSNQQLTLPYFGGTGPHGEKVDAKGIGHGD